MSDFKISLAAARKNKNLTQKEVAIYMNTAKETISCWERGLSEPKATQALMLSELYEIPFDNLIFLPSKLAKSENFC